MTQPPADDLVEIGAQFDQSGRLELPMNDPAAKELLRAVMKHTTLADPPRYNAPALANEAYMVGKREAAAELTRLRAMCDELAGAVERLGSMEAFVMSRSIIAFDDDELLARIAFAEAAYAKYQQEQGR